ncbi:retron Ec48 family effector membrane protein [Halomonas alkaliantarctica]|uniref:Retron Ec48 family effector membrane protein n=1 Tax=Halomonas alkaliantarctica TaxID=232346 RepID=A0ABY8LIG7_9GAMM|nr:retron Ec48 family effector membrane protein [Halomonas alkaliantarctica]WGI24250.1 retron Ec48 family effector membrane protein [Halomonas alkaliantarctica]
MKDLSVKIKNHPLMKGEFLFITVVCIFIIVFGFISSVIVFLWTFYEIEAYKLSFCLSSSCIGNFADSFEFVFIILKITGASLAGIFTLGTLGVAVSNYVTSKKAFATSNHIAHLNIFREYVSSEVYKRDLLSGKSFDALKWYNLIFNESSVGIFTISNDYYDFLKRVNKQIEFSNNLKIRKAEGGYRYTHHQTNMIDILSCAGIQLNRLSRIDFYNVESQVFDLIDTINSSYCMIDMNRYNLVERLYE